MTESTPVTSQPATVDAKIKRLQQGLNRRLKGFEHYSRRFSSLHRYFAFLLAAFAALNTLFVAINETEVFEQTINFGLCALVASAAIGFIATIESNIQARDKYLKNAESLRAIHDIKARLEWRLLEIDKPMTQAEVDTLHDEYRNVVNQFFGEFAELSKDD